MATYSSKKYPSGSVTSATLADGSVVAVDLADGAVTSAKLNSTVDLSGKTVTYRSIVAGDIASDAITTAKVAANAVTPAKMANSGAELGMRNRIINGAMTIDQRNAGAIQTPVDSGYTLDRWKFYSSQAGKLTSRQTPSATETGYAGRLAAGFNNYLAYTSTSAYTITSGDYFCPLQAIEGYNIADFAFGTSSAKPITLSFWVNSSLNGTFTGALTNSGNTRSIAFTYTISSANTWEQKSITLPGCTDGTWNITNGMGIEVRFSLGVAGGYAASTTGVWAAANYVGAVGGTSVVGTNGATWYVTGVQLEVGTVATSFDFRPYGTELALCQRYNIRYGFPFDTTQRIVAAGYGGGGTTSGFVLQMPVSMRTAPTMTYSLGTGFSVNDGTAAYSASALGTNLSNIQNIGIAVTQSTSVTSKAVSFYATSTDMFINLSAEL